MHPAPTPFASLANNFVTLFESPDPQRLFAYRPGIACLPSGLQVATIGPGAVALSEPNYQRGEMGILRR